MTIESNISAPNNSMKRMVIGPVTWMCFLFSVVKKAAKKEETMPTKTPIYMEKSNDLMIKNMAGMINRPNATSIFLSLLLLNNGSISDVKNGVAEKQIRPTDALASLIEP